MSSEPDIQHERSSSLAAWRAKLGRGSLPPSSPPPAPSSPAARPSGFEVHRDVPDRDVPAPELAKPARDDPFGFFAAERRLRARPPPASRASTATAALRDPRPSFAASVREDHSRRSPSPSSTVSHPTRAPLRTKDANAPVSRTADARPIDKPGESKIVKARKDQPVAPARAAQTARRRTKKPMKVSEDAEENPLPPEVDEEEEQRKRIEYFKSLDKYELHKEDVYII